MFVASLAYLTAATHGLLEQAQILREQLEEQGKPVPEVPSNARLLLPPTPILRGDIGEGAGEILESRKNWPLLNIGRDPLAGFDLDSAEAIAAVEEDLDVSTKKSNQNVITNSEEGWDDLDIDITENKYSAEENLIDSKEESGWDLDNDLDVPELSTHVPVRVDHAVVDVFALPAFGIPPSTRWCESSSLAADHIAAGSFETAMQVFLSLF